MQKTDTKKAVIIEDEVLTADNLRRLLAEVAPTYEVTAMLTSVEDSVEWFRQHTDYQLVFMDILLADGVSFDILSEVEVTSPIIFTTAYDKYALQAFSVNSVDYLLKPVSPDDLRRAMEKIESLGSMLQPTDNHALTEILSKLHDTEERRAHHFLIQKGDRLIPLDASDIAYFMVNEHAVTAVDFSSNTYPIDGSMDDLMNMLDPRDFYRANRQFVVAHKAVSEMVLWFGGRLDVRLIIPTPERILVSRTKVKEFKQWYMLTM